MHTIEAQYPGRCDANGCRFEAGDEVAYVKGYSKPLCLPCATDETIDFEPGDACKDCHLVHAGECW